MSPSDRATVRAVTDALAPKEVYDYEAYHGTTAIDFSESTLSYMLGLLHAQSYGMWRSDSFHKETVTLRLSPAQAVVWSHIKGSFDQANGWPKIEVEIQWPTKSDQTKSFTKYWWVETETHSVKVRYIA